MLNNANRIFIDDVNTTLKIILKDNNTLFDDLIKSLENNKEVQISEEKRLDVVITYNKMKYIDDKNLWTIVL